MERGHFTQSISEYKIYIYKHIIFSLQSLFTEVEVNILRVSNLRTNGQKS